MATSLGYALSYMRKEIAKKRKKKSPKKDLKREAETQTLDIKEECQECIKMKDRICSLSVRLESVEKENCRIINEHRNKESIVLTKYRKINDSLSAETDVLKSELRNMKNSLSSQLQERDRIQNKKIASMEKGFTEKEKDYAKKIESLRKELRDALHASIEDTERESSTMTTLQKEIDSLRSVLDMRTDEIHTLRDANNRLGARLENYYRLESELNKAGQRIQEMEVIVQGKLDSERELLQMMESMHNELNQCRSELSHCKSQLENRQYLRARKNSEEMSKIQNNRDSGIVYDVVEKMDSVAWMVQIPASPALKLKHGKS